MLKNAEHDQRSHGNRTGSFNTKQWAVNLKRYKDYEIEIKTFDVSQLKTHSSEKYLMEDSDDRRTIKRYANKMKQGSVFPLIEVVPMRNGKFDVTDGNHRFLAWKLLGRKTIPAVVIYREKRNSK